MRIAILTKNADAAIEDVMDWILHLGAVPIRINEEDIVHNRKIEFTIEDKEFNIILKFLY